MTADLRALLTECKNVLQQYTNVVSSVNDPSNFCPQVKDEGGPARGLLARIDAALSREPAETTAERDALERAAKTCESRIGNGDYSMDSKEAAWDSEAQGCANFIRALMPHCKSIEQETLERAEKIAHDIAIAAFVTREQYRNDDVDYFEIIEQTGRHGAATEIEKAIRGLMPAEEKADDEG